MQVMSAGRNSVLNWHTETASYLNCFFIYLFIFYHIHAVIWAPALAEMKAAALHSVVCNLQAVSVDLSCHFQKHRKAHKSAAWHITPTHAVITMQTLSQSDGSVKRKWQNPAETTCGQLRHMRTGDKLKEKSTESAVVRCRVTVSCEGVQCRLSLCTCSASLKTPHLPRV